MNYQRNKVKRVLKEKQPELSKMSGKDRSAAEKHIIENTQTGIEEKKPVEKKETKKKGKK